MKKLHAAPKDPALAPLRFRLNNSSSTFVAARKILLCVNYFRALLRAGLPATSAEFGCMRNDYVDDRDSGCRADGLLGGA